MRLCKSSLITKLIILCVMVYAVVTIVSLQPDLDEMKAEQVALQEQIAAAEQANLELAQDIETINSDEAVMQIARERLSLVADGEMVFIDSSK